MSVEDKVGRAGTPLPARRGTESAPYRSINPMRTSRFPFSFSR
jgi:hypothetical protein